MWHEALTDLLTLVRWAYKAALEHEAVIGLLCLAFVITMRPKLPDPFCRVEIVEWCYEWLYDALRAFVSFRSPPPPGESRTTTDITTHAVEQTPKP